MADIVSTSDLTVPDNSSLSTGDLRRNYGKKKKKKKCFKLAKNKYKVGA